MSEAIQCDRCKLDMYADSRSPKGSWGCVSVDYTDGHSSFHLCKSCLRIFLTKFMECYTPDEFDETFSPIYLVNEEGGSDV